MKRLLFLTLFLSLSHLGAIERSETKKTSLWQRTTFLFSRVLNALDEKLMSSKFKKSSTYQGVQASYFVKEWNRKLKLYQSATITSFPYLEDFPKYEPGPLTFSPKTVIPDEDQEKAKVFLSIIELETRTPTYQSFFHGANSGHAAIFTLYKMLYEKFNKRKVKDFEFLRSPKGRQHLIGISREKYFEQNPYIHDSYDPYRTDLLSVACFPWQQSVSLYLYNYSFNHIPIFNLIQNALNEYDLPTPSDLPHIPYQKKGILFHILIAPDVTEKITYEGSSSYPYGSPILSDDLLPSTQTLRKKSTL